MSVNVFGGMYRSCLSKRERVDKCRVTGSGWHTNRKGPPMQVHAAIHALGVSRTAHARTSVAPSRGPVSMEPHMGNQMKNSASVRPMVWYPMYSRPWYLVRLQERQQQQQQQQQHVGIMGLCDGEVVG